MSNLRCEDLPGRLRDICRGHDEQGNPVLTPEKCERYRKFFVDGQFGTDHKQAAKAIDPRSDKRAAVKNRLEQRKRLIGWLHVFRLPADRGIGDTAHRLNIQSRSRPELHAVLEKLLKQCSCSRADAVERLNREWPYLLSSEPHGTHEEHNNA